MTFLNDMRPEQRYQADDWSVWFDWYLAILEGKPTPGGEELDIYRVTLDSEDDWKKSPAHVNALIKKREEEIAARSVIIRDHVEAEIRPRSERMEAETASRRPVVDEPDAQEEPAIPDELPGITWVVDGDAGEFMPAYRRSAESGAEIADLESQRPFLLECARDLCTAIEASSSNSLKMLLLPRAKRYLDAINKHSSLISIDEVYAAGHRLRNAREQIRRDVLNDDMPQTASDIGEAADSVIGLHGPFVLSTRRGRDADARARSHNRTRQQELDYKRNADQFADVISRTSFVSEEGKAEVRERVDEIGVGPIPERSTMLAENANTNLLVAASRFVIANYSSAVILGTGPGQTATAFGVSLAGEVAAWLLANQGLLLAMALSCPESLGWLPYFLTWLKSRLG